VRAAAGYLTASRGYKAGGFNIGLFVPEDAASSNPNTCGTWRRACTARVTTVVSRRTFRCFTCGVSSSRSPPRSSSTRATRSRTCSTTDNAARGRNAGLEATLAWRPIDSLTLGSTLGLLHTEYVGLPLREPGPRRSRAGPCAGGGQYSLSAEWTSLRGWMARADLYAATRSTSTPSHDQRSDPYALLNSRWAYSGGAWSAYLWGRNLFDERYAVRGLLLRSRAA